ncbi:MAG: hypothetical protein Q9191_000445 [Dirinaria sp. TL-2023a]
MSPCARLLARQNALRPNRALLQNFRIPSAARVNCTRWDKRSVHGGKTRRQPRDAGTKGVGRSQAGRSEKNREKPKGPWQSRKIEVPINGKTQVFDSLLLRDACTCERCIDQSTTQRLFDTVDIPLSIQGKDLEVHGDGSFSVSWTSDVPGYEDHRSHFPPDYFKWMWHADLAAKHLCQRKYLRLLWTQGRLKKEELGTSVTYDAYMTDQKAYRKVLEDLIESGIAFINTVPNVSESVAEIGDRMGGLQNTIYGPTWDVRSRPSAKNAADTSSDLGFHMDLLYYKEPPKLQILHCLKQSDEGGETLFSDSFSAVYHRLTGFKNVRERSRWVVALTHFKQPFHYKNNGYWLRHSHPTLVTDEQMNPQTEDDWARLDEYFKDPSQFIRALQAVRWSPPYQAPGIKNIGNERAMNTRLAAARQLKKSIQWPSAIYQTKLQEGTCVIFDNARVVHARKAFSGSERWLRGAYIDETTFAQQVLSLGNAPRNSYRRLTGYQS